MKSWIRLSVLRRCSFILAGAVPLAAWSQGPLLPAGAPAPTMKTLDQVEPRIPIGQADTPMTITNAGSYILAGNLISPSATPIAVNADDVTIDLAGFTIKGGENGISIGSGRSGVRIENGKEEPGPLRGLVIRTGLNFFTWSASNVARKRNRMAKSLRLNSTTA